LPVRGCSNFNPAACRNCRGGLPCFLTNWA
jgi:hypothetical protein